MNEHKKRTNKLWMRIGIVALCLVMAFGTTVTIMASSFNGDLDGDGQITAYDAQLLAEYQAGHRDLDPATVIGLTVRGIIDRVLGRIVDEPAEEPSLADGIEKTFEVTAEDGVVTKTETFEFGIVTVTVPEGAKVNDTELTVTVKQKDSSEGGITLEDGQELLPLDIHVAGVAADNTAPIIISVAEALDAGMNLGNLTLYHVENGVANPMTQVMSAEELTAHNQFYYDPVTGDITVSMATFSEVALVSETDKGWKGGVDHSWYVGKESPYTIANADQLWSFSQIVGGMAKDENGNYIYTATNSNGEEYHHDTFAGDTINLIADINLADGEAANDAAKIFYPIGYYNSEGTYNKSGTAVTSGLYTFQGEFDGQGHTVENIYQNTWEMKGDHDWYAPEDQHYRDGMGLFGKVYGGTVKNLTVRNFKSDGEIATTGCIAAYADFGATFENISIFNCNPRVYNIGNGGIVGCVGWYTKGTTDQKVTFKNITVDNSNKISALWGSYDVACGGIVGQYYPTSGQSSANYPVNAGVHFENCHVAAVMDVYNDVCANYQYYAYRYTGMLIGSIRENVTGDDGHVYPKMDGITASGCTVHFGDWNDYYYCELVANSLASYTHDHQMSRLTQVASVDVENMKVTPLGGEPTDIPTSGRVNYVVVKEKDGNGLWIHGDGHDYADCYHFVNGVQHFHDVADTDNPTPWEMVDGVETLKEDKQLVYREFNQLFTGYGWGVTSKGLTDFEGVENMDITLGEHDESVEKFVGTGITSVTTGETIKLSDLFAAIADSKVAIVPQNIQVAVNDVDATDGTVTAVFVNDADNWQNGTLTFTGTGRVQVTIQDYYFCTPTTIELTVEDRQPVEKFEKLFTSDKFTYRIGDDNAVKLSNLFVEKDGATIGNVTVTVTEENGNASGVWTPNATWTEGTIQFSGAGKVKVTIKDDDTYCIPTELTLEVVDAVNTTGAASATANNVVLLQDAGFGSLEVSGGYTLYGNGFTLTCGSDSVAADLGYSFVTLNNGTLDNVQIVCPNFDYAALYKSNLTSSDNRSNTDSSGKTRYYNARSGVMVSGNSQILNSRISGGRAAVNVAGGNLLIDNSRIELGAVANILVGAANSLTLRDVTLVQKPTESTYNNPTKTLMGFSVLYICDADGKATSTTLEGELIQRAWVKETDKQYVPSAGQDIVSSVLEKENFLHDIDGDGTKESLNLGFAYMPEDTSSTVEKPDNIEDNRDNQDAIPYQMQDVKIQISILSTTVYVYSYVNTNGTEDITKNDSQYEANQYGDIIAISYSDTADGLVAGKSFGTDGWVYELNVDLDKQSGYALDFSKLSMSVNGEIVTDYAVNGTAKPTTPVEVTAGGVTYTLTATVSGVEYTAYYKVTGTETSKESPSLVASNYEAGLCVASSKGGTWHGAAPALKGIQIKYWSVAEKQYKTINLADYTPTSKGQLNGTNTTWTYSPDNGDFTLTLTGGQVHSSNNVYAMPVCVEDNGTYTLYFVAAKSSGLVNSGNSARTIPVTYTFKDNNNGDVLTFSHTWSVAENQDNEYSYSDLCSGKLTKLESSGGGCVTGDTLITLADGTKKRADQITYNDQLLVWDFFKGEYTVSVPSAIYNYGEKIHKVTNLKFSDGTTVKMIAEHEFFDVQANSFVYICEDNVQEFVGHRFLKRSGDQYTSVILTGYEYTEEYTGSYVILTAVHYNCFSEDMFSLTADPSYKCENFFRIFAVGEGMKFDEEKMQADIAKYGLYTYADFSAYVTYEEFIAFGGAYFKVLVGKGLLEFEDILQAVATYAP